MWVAIVFGWGCVAKLVSRGHADPHLVEGLATRDYGKTGLFMELFYGEVAPPISNQLPFESFLVVSERLLLAGT